MASTNWGYGAAGYNAIRNEDEGQPSIRLSRRARLAAGVAVAVVLLVLLCAHSATPHSSELLNRISSAVGMNSYAHNGGGNTNTHSGGVFLSDEERGSGFRQHISFPYTHSSHYDPDNSRDAFIQSIREDVPDDVASCMNFSVDPCNNFYEFVCADWIQKTHIPEDKGSASKSWDGAQDTVLRRLRRLYEDHSEHRFWPLNYWFSACMDLDRGNRLGAEPLQPLLNMIEGIQTYEDFWDVTAYLFEWAIPHFFEVDVGLGVRVRDNYTFFVSAGGVVLPSPGYYNITVEDDEDADEVSKHVDEREHLRLYYKQINMLTGLSEEEADAAANRTIEIETALAQFNYDEPLPPEAEKDLGPELIDLNELEARYPNFKFTNSFQRERNACHEVNRTCGESLFNMTKNIVVRDPYFFEHLDYMFGNYSADYWIPYIRTHTIYNLAPLLTEEFLKASLALDEYMYGVTSLPPRWHKCVIATAHGLPSFSDLKFLEHYFDGKAYREGWDILSRIKSAFIEDLHEVKWMDNSTKTRALAKAHKMALNLGSPKHYSVIEYPVVNNSYFNNSAYAYRTKRMRMFMMLDEPYDTTRWTMRATTINAYYDNGVNGLFVPAGMMQPPFFNDTYRMERNFGGIGSIMGHEVTHGFDNLGAKFDEFRNVKDWWSTNVVQKFKEKTQCIAGLYSGFRIANTDLDGNVSLGENIADFGGMKTAHRAFMEWHREAVGSEATEEQRRLFFISYGQLWCDKERFKAQQKMVNSDAHSPSPFRTNGVVSQNQDFADMFRCPAGAPMNPVYKCVLWEDENRGEELVGRSKAKQEEKRRLRGYLRRQHGFPNMREEMNRRF